MKVRTSCSVLRAALVAGVVALALNASAGYTRLPWIKAGGAQWIYTGYTPACTDKVELKVKFANVSDTQTLYCSRGNSTGTSTFTAFLLSGKVRFDRRSSVSGPNSSALAVGQDYVITADGNSLVCTVNDADVDKMSSGTFTPPNPFTLFASYTAETFNPAKPPTMGNWGSYTLYYFRVYDKGGQLVREYLPARDDSAAPGVAKYGLYETKEGKFYEGRGTGSFEALSDDEFRYNSNTEQFEYRLTVTYDETKGSVKANEQPVASGWTLWSPMGSQDQVTLKPSPVASYRFFFWDGDVDGLDVGDQGVLTVSVAMPRTLTCHFVPSGSDSVLRRWTGGAGDNLWESPNNWTPVGAPKADDVVSLPSDSQVLVASATPQLYDLKVYGKLTFTNWTTCVSARNIVVKNGATVTCAGPFNDTFDMSNRVWFAASEAFTLETGATINVNELGYGTATNVTAGRGGMGPGKAGWDGGAAYGGETVYRKGYGNSATPTDPGTSGGARTSGVHLWPGGGAVFLDCPNATVEVTGTISANGHAGSDWNYGPSTGGSIYIRTKRFKTSGATITAIGGNRSGRASTASGGRIAVTYDPSVQTKDDFDSSTLISADCGLLGNNRTVPPGWNQSSSSTTATDNGRWARPGTVYFPDDLLLGKTLGNPGFSGEIVLGSGKTAVVDRGFTLSDGCVVFGNDLTNVTVKGDVNLDSVNGYLIFGANKHLTGYTRTQLFVNEEGVAPRLEIDGNLTMTLGSRLDLCGVFTGTDGEPPAGVLDVKGDILMSGQTYDSAKGLPALTSIVYCVSCPTNGSGFHVFASNVVIGAEARFDGVGFGYQALNSNADANGRGPGRGSRTIGAGHGGAAVGATATYGKTYDEEMRPKLPGSSGAPPNARQLANSDSYGVTTGGGYLRLTAYELMEVSGSITMDGWTPTVGSDSSRCAAGSGGSLWLEAKNFMASAGANVSAKGGDSMYNGAAGGGRIALWLGAPGLGYDEIAAYSETTAADAGIPDGVLSVDGGWTKSRGEGTVQAGNGTLKIYNAVPRGQNLEIVKEPLDAFGTCEPGYGAHTVAPGERTYTATDVTDPETRIRSRCIGWALERLNAETGLYEPVRNGDTAECVFTMDDAMYRLTWKWTFEAKVAVTPAVGGMVGFSAPPKDAGWYTLGSAVTLTPNPSSGYAFTTWGGDVADDKTLDNPLTIAVDAAKALTCGFQAVVPGGQRFTWTGGGENGVWYDIRNWRNDSGVAGLPIVDDTVEFPEDSGTVVLDRPTAELTALTVSSGTTLLATNWTTAIRAQTMTVADGGTVTCAGPFSDRYTAAYQNIDMSNRVWIVCGALNVEQGGTITVDGKGYGEPTGISSSAARAYGSGGTAACGCGGAHGGVGQKYGDGVALKAAYDSLTNPELPGSSGGCGVNSARCAPGGGVIRVEATGTVRLDGTLTAKGAAGGSWKSSGGGAGGTVYISANKVTANGGVVCAAGGAANNGTDNMTAGGGGRIAIHYDTAAQQSDDIVALTLDAAPGAVAGSYRDIKATPGTIWSSDMTLFKFVGSEHLKGAIAAGDARELTLPGMTVTNTYFAVDGSVTNLTIAGDLKVAGPTTRFLFGANELVYNMTENMRFTAEEIPYRLQVAGDFTVTDGAAADFNAAPTNGLDGTEGAYVDVAGDFTVEGAGAVTSLVRTAVHPLVGATVSFTAENVAIRQAGWVTADGLGWAIARGNQGGGRGPSPGLAQSNPDEWGKTRGGGHGGEGIRAAAGHGTTYDSELRPTMAGSSGGSSWGYGKEGGGYIHLRARKQMTVAGRISADAIMGSYERAAAGSGGGILLEAHKFAATETAMVTAVGGNHTTDVMTGLGTNPKKYDIGGAAGGGGRIAVLTGLPWKPSYKVFNFLEYSLDQVFPVGSVCSVAGGASGSSGKYPPAAAGTFKVYRIREFGACLILR